MRKSILAGMVSVYLLVGHVQGTVISLENSAFTLLSEKRIRTGKGVRVNGLVGAVDEVRLGRGTVIDSDVYTDGRFKSAPLAFVTGRLVANNDIRITSRAKIGMLDGDGDAQIGKRSIIFGNIAVSGNLQLHPQAIILGERLPNNDSWSAASLPDPIATSFLPADTLDNIIVAKDGSDNLDPGNYADLKLKKNATLILTAGTYFFDQIKLGKASTLITDTRDGAVIINVAHKMKSSSRASIEKEGTEEVLLTIFGKTKIGNRNNLFTNIITHDKLKIGNNSNLTGFFYSKDDLLVGKQVIINGLSQAEPIVPEPTSLFFLTLGTAAILTKKRRRRALS